MINRFVSPIVRPVIFLCVVAAELGSPVMAQRSLPPALNPVTYKSPSARYALTVDPSDMYGCGPAGYRCAKDGKTLWSSELPFTLYEAGITDAGVAGGYGYTHGPSGFLGRGPGEGPGEFLVVILGPDGKIRLKESVKRAESSFLHGPTDPVANGLIFDERNDRIVVRVGDPDLNRGHESWWVYRISTASLTGKLTPVELMSDSQAARWILDAKPISGTPLTLVHWWRFDLRRDRNSVGARFTLIDLNAKPVWSLELPNDYTVADDEKATDKIRNLIRERGGILRSDQLGHFDLLYAAESRRVTFEVKPDGSDKWTVTEVGRTPFAFSSSPRPPLEAAVIPERELKSLGPLVLRGDQAAPRPSIRDVRNFVIDGAGRIAFLREDDDQTAFVLVDPMGKVPRELPLNMEPKSPDSHWSGYGWVGGDFILTRSDFGPDGKCRAWRVDMRAGKVERLASFDCPPVERLRGFADGAFVAFARLRSKFTMEEFVIGFDERGKRTWTLKDDFNDKRPEALFSVQDVALTSTGEVAVLQGIINQIKFFDRDGHYLRQVELEKAWRRKPNYVARIGRDIDGGVIVEDFHGSPPFVRMKRDCTVRGGLQPRHADGRIVQTLDGIQTAPDGNIWTCDGHSVLRLNSSGVVDRVLGESPQAAQLARIAGVFVGPHDWIFVVDSRVGSIHVFDTAGQFLHVCQTKPTDFSGEIWFPAVTFDGQGTVYLGLGDGMSLSENKRRYLRFSEKGVRLEPAVLPAADCHFQTATGNIVARDYEAIRLIDPAGKTIRTIQRRPDGNWLERPDAATVAPNGAMAILAESRSDRRATVNLYKANGDPVRTVLLPESIGRYLHLAYDGRRIVVTGESGLIIYDGSGAAVLHSKVPIKVQQGSFYYPYILAGGRELALFDGKTLALHRFEMP